MARSRTTWTPEQARSTSQLAAARAGLVHAQKAAFRARQKAQVALGLNRGETRAKPGPEPISTLARTVADAVLARAASVATTSRPRPGRRSRPGPAPELVIEYAEPASVPGSNPAPGPVSVPDTAPAPAPGPGPTPVRPPAWIEEEG